MDFKSINLKKILDVYLNNASSSDFCLKSLSTVIDLKDQLNLYLQYLINEDNPQKIVGLSFHHVARQVELCEEFLETYEHELEQFRKRNTGGIEGAALLLSKQQTFATIKELYLVYQSIEYWSCCYFDELESAY